MKRLDDKKFVIVYDGKPVDVEVYSTGASSVYLATFKDLDPLFLTESIGSDGVAFWTSVPEGRLKLAGEIGRLIETRPGKARAEQSSLF